MKKVLLIVLLFASCVEKNRDDDKNNPAQTKVFIQVEAIYKGGKSDLSPIVSINL